MSQHTLADRLRYAGMVARSIVAGKGSAVTLGEIAPIVLSFLRTYRPRSADSFMMDGRSFRYFRHFYNVTWYTERTVEIPVIWPLVQRAQAKRILEVGNVLSHYFPVTHHVLDKYERANGVINQDVVDFHPGTKYDLIVSISTLEHVGWDEQPRDPPKVARAIDHLRGLLAPDGQLIATVPVGFNPVLDDYLSRGVVTFDKSYYMRRVSADNRWIQTEWNDIRHAQFNSPFPRANALVVGTSYSQQGQS